MKTFVYISSWTHGEPDSGIGIYEMNNETGALTFIEKVEPDVSFNTTFVYKDRGIVYALNETDKLPGRRAGGGGRVFTFRIDKETGRLTKLGCVLTFCPNPAFMTLDAEGKYAVVANHGAGGAATKVVQDLFGNYSVEVVHDDVCVELFEVNEDGTLGKLLDVVKHEPGLDRRSAMAHPHTAVMSPDGKLFATCDKGNDTVRMYGIDRENNKLFLQSAPRQYAFDTKPRYCVFHPTRPYFYHNNEKCMDLYAFRYNEKGELTFINAESTLPEGYERKPGPQEQQGLCIHPNGKFVYDIARNPNGACVFQINEETGAITKIQTQVLDEEWPRGCAITPDGRFLIVCGLRGNKAYIFSVGEDGKLTDTGNRVDQFAAAYVSFLQV